MKEELLEMLLEMEEVVVEEEEEEFNRKRLVLQELYSRIISPLPYKRKPKTARDRVGPWNFIQSFPEQQFKNHFRVSRTTFNEIIKRMISVYPGPQGSGFLNYERSLHKGQCSTPRSGAITLELKLCITLRLLAGASHCDMVWFFVLRMAVIKRKP